VQKAIRRNKLQYDKFDYQVELITKINPISLFQANMEQSIMEEQKELLMIQANAAAAAQPGQSTNLGAHSSTP